MDLALTAADRAFRDEIRKFLAEAVPPSMRRAEALTTGFVSDPDVARDFHRALAAKGWSVYAWPKEYGGMGWTPVQRYIFEVECARAGAPAFNSQGVRMVGPVIMHYGTAAQKDHYLPRIRSGEHYWCQGYSEPGAGSDLASLKTKAVLDGDHYVVNGQKIWTSYAHKANRMFMLVRTSSAGKRQDGITFLLLDMNLPGITVRPIVGSGGDHEVNEVFFDDVRVPVAGRVGEENKGWEVAKFLLEFERGAGMLAGRARSRYVRLLALVRRHAPDDPDIATRAAEIGTDLDAMEMIELSLLSALQAGTSPGPTASLLKLRWSQIRQAMSELAVEAAGEAALRWVPERPLYETLQLPPDEEELLGLVPRYFNDRALSILAGTSEVQVGILARSMLGL
ncbi:MAG TPA: acyl-CoA dehydrogenase family protein [Alphaproteobacteria bacterium]|nr:acyl-CoA dehydrogenase family protein [Alphaproteobacteria bacterium]